MLPLKTNEWDASLRWHDGCVFPKCQMLNAAFGLLLVRDDEFICFSLNAKCQMLNAAFKNKWDASLRWHDGCVFPKCQMLNAAFGLLLVRDDESFVFP